MESKTYRVLFNNGGIPMWMSFKTQKEADDFGKSFHILKRDYPKAVKA